MTLALTFLSFMDTLKEMCPPPPPLAEQNEQFPLFRDMWGVTRENCAVPTPSPLGLPAASAPLWDLCQSPESTRLDKTPYTLTHTAGTPQSPSHPQYFIIMCCFLGTLLTLRFRWGHHDLSLGNSGCGAHIWTSRLCLVFNNWITSVPPTTTTTRLCGGSVSVLKPALFVFGPPQGIFTVAHGVLGGARAIFLKS